MESRSARASLQLIDMGEARRNLDRRWNILKEIHHEALAKGLDKLSIKEIDQEVRTARRELAARTS